MAKSKNAAPSILVVDDDPIAVSTIKKLLNKYGYEVYNVTNGRSCLVALRKYEFDLIILSVMMPIYDGQSTIIDIKTHHEFKDIPVIATSSSRDPKIQKAAQLSGADHFLNKPLHKESLLDSVSHYVYQYRSRLKAS